MGGILSDYGWTTLANTISFVVDLDEGQEMC